MTRSLLAVMMLGSAVLLSASPGCTATGVGDPCTPEQEYDPTFNGFDEKEVNVESKSFQCQTRLCLVNHFKGRVSCPYGQESSGGPPIGGTKSCTVPGSTDPITGNPNDTKKQKAVSPQCIDRVADKAVYCSCRCANLNRKTDDGANYCTCPDGFACVPLVSSIGQGNEGLTGSYCIKNGTDYTFSSCGSSCDAALKNCGNP